MSDCIFCKISREEIPANFLYEDDEVFAIRDISPQAPVHFLVITKKHFDSLNDISDEKIMASILKAIKAVAHEEGVAESGFRIIINTNSLGGQTVFHFHAHVLAGKQMPGRMV